MKVRRENAIGLDKEETPFLGRLGFDISLKGFSATFRAFSTQKSQTAIQKFLLSSDTHLSHKPNKTPLEVHDVEALSAKKRPECAHSRRTQDRN
jgi:hypothetical protein